jgi:hypothetical protein
MTMGSVKKRNKGENLQRKKRDFGTWREISSVLIFL